MNRLAFLIMSLLPFAALSGPVVKSETLTLEGARAVVASAIDYAVEHNAPGGTIAIVDSGGHLVLLERLDNTFAASADVSIGKARTAALFRKPTRVFEELVNKGRTTMVTLPAVTAFTPLQGGVPLEFNGTVVGAIGVSGAASAQQDDDIATAAAEQFKTGPKLSSVTHIRRSNVEAAFAVGEPLLEGGRYKVNASRRDGPGEAEIHQNDTDIFYILEGSATFVTGGDLVNARSTAAGELRGSAIAGGIDRQLSAGDVITIPAGVPHWFENVDTALVYYVVKSNAGIGG